MADIEDTLVRIYRDPYVLRTLRCTDYTKKTYRMLCEVAISIDPDIIQETDVEESAVDKDLRNYVERHNHYLLPYIPNEYVLNANIYVASAMRSFPMFHATFMIVPDDSSADHIHVALANARPYLWLVCARCAWTKARGVPPMSAILAAVRKDGMAIRYVHTRWIPDAVIEAAVRQNPLAIAHVPHHKVQMSLDCYRRNKNAFALIVTDYGRQYVARATLAELILALHPLGLSPNLVVEICVDLLCATGGSALARTALARTALFPRSYINAHSSEEQDAEYLLVHTFGRPQSINCSREVTGWSMPLHAIWKLVCLIVQ